MKWAVRYLRVLFAVIALVPAYAEAVGLYFETAATTSSATCPEPCFQIRMFIEDPTRNIEFQAIQMDVDIFGGGTPAVLPVPPARNANADDGNVTVELDEETVVAVPWELAATVGRSPTAGFDALLVNASVPLFDVKAFAALFAAQLSCAPVEVCGIVGTGLAANRIYLGRFNATLDGAPVFIRVAGITGNGPGVQNPSYGLIRLNGGECNLSSGGCHIDSVAGHGQAPEPASVILMAAALALLGVARRAARVFRIFATAVLLVAGFASAEPPALIQYQGILLQPDGTPRVGPVDLEVAVFDAPVEGNELYRESHLGVSLVDGFFTISLGGGQDRAPSTLSPGLFTGPGTRWLQVSVDGELLVPRQQFLSVPYSFEAASAVSLQGQSLAQVVSAPSPVSGYEQISASAPTGAADASCPAGKVAVGGGCDCAGSTTESRPVGGSNSWHCECSTADAANRAWVLCAASGGGVCGNGLRDAAEQCDSASAAGCPDGRCGAGCVCACGNGVLESPEQCDAFSASACPNDACGADCRCTCGNGALDPGEQCDGAASQTCPAGSSGCRVDCTCGICGDGVVDGVEQCDGSAAGACTNNACGGDCRCTCGNGVLDPGEQCDGAATELCPVDSTGCSASCGCLRCGDGVCTAPETATSCPGDCFRSYRRCSSDDACDPGLFCVGFCTDSCFRTCDLDPGYDEICSSSSTFGYCIPLCRLDPATSRYVCPGDLHCSDPVNGGTCG